MNIRRIIQVTSVVVIAAGLALLAPLGYYWLHDKEAVANASTISAPPVKPPVLPKKPDVISGIPIEIKIASQIPLDLQVVPGYYDASTGQWNLSLTQAQYATPTVEPNNYEGNTLIYGHYRPAVFAYLHLIRPGNTATVITSNGYAFTYTYESTQAFDPTDTSIFSYQGAPRLTIQTCSGTFMQHRQMYYFKYDGYKKIK